MNERDLILLSHGGGGRLMHELIRDLFRARLRNPLLEQGDDSAVMKLGGARVAFTTDSFVVDPLFFPGGDIGRLAVCGTINDLAAMGAEPVAISASFIIEEGLPRATLERVVDSMQATAQEAGVQVVTGDTKVVTRGAADQLFITTSGLGLVPAGIEISGSGARPGDVVLISGPVGDHGIAVMSTRQGLALETEVVSDCAPLHGLVAAILASVPAAVHAMRDPTRGGLAASLNEIAEQSQVCIEIEEQAVPVRLGVRTACELLGLDPLYSANEGKMLVIAAPDHVPVVLEAMSAHPLGAESARIGVVLPAPPARVHLRTALGTRRILDLPSGEQLPRIC